jgi:hypothetical protein
VSLCVFCAPLHPILSRVDFEQVFTIGDDDFVPKQAADIFQKKILKETIFRILEMIDYSSGGH